ncbi:MAG: hypothetical protein ACE366_27160 [Bradymonadia bacterium]
MKMPLMMLACGLATGCNGGHPAVVETGHTAQAHPIFSPRLRSEDTFAETWSAVADLEDGSYLQVQLGITNVGPGSDKGVCRLLYVPSQGKSISGTEKVDSDDWRHEATPHSTLVMGPCRGEATDDRLLISGRVEAHQFSLTLDTPPRRIAPPGHHVTVEEAFYTSNLLVPWAGAEVKLTLEGSAERTLTGRGYADHSRATTLPADLARQWVRVRRLAQGKGLLAILRYPPAEGAAPDGWIWTEGTEAPVPLAEGSTEALAAIKAKGAWHIKARDTASGAFDVHSGPLLHRAAPVEDQGMLAPIIEAVIGNPVTYTYRLSGGVMEVTIVDE